MSLITPEIESLIVITDESKESVRSEISCSTVSIELIRSEISCSTELVNVEMLLDNVWSNEEIISSIAESADSLSVTSCEIESSMLIIAFINASSFVKSIELTKSTTSLNWSKSISDPSSIESILPAWTSILDWSTPSAVVALASSSSKLLITPLIESLIVITDESKESVRFEISCSTVSIAPIRLEISVSKESVNTKILSDKDLSKDEIVSSIAESADSLSVTSCEIEFSILITAFINDSSLDKSIDWTKSTTSLNWSKSTSDPSRIASILPAWTSMLDWSSWSPAILASDSALSAEALCKISAAIASSKLDWSSWSPAILASDSALSAEALCKISASKLLTTSVNESIEVKSVLEIISAILPSIVPSAAILAAVSASIAACKAYSADSALAISASKLSTTSVNESIEVKSVLEIISAILPSIVSSAAILAAVSAAIAVSNEFFWTFLWYVSVSKAEVKADSAAIALVVSLSNADCVDCPAATLSEISLFNESCKAESPAILEAVSDSNADVKVDSAAVSLETSEDNADVKTPSAVVALASSVDKSDVNFDSAASALAISSANAASFERT